MAKLCSSFTMTLNDSGSPGSRTFSPLTIASYIRVRPATSSDSPLLSPNGKVLWGQSAMIGGKAERGKTQRVQVQLDRFPFLGLGKYHFVVEERSASGMRARAAQAPPQSKPVPARGTTRRAPHRRPPTASRPLEPPTPRN